MAKKLTFSQQKANFLVITFKILSMEKSAGLMVCLLKQFVEKRWLTWEKWLTWAIISCRLSVEV